MIVMTVNTGSSSVRLAAFAPQGESLSRLASGHFPGEWSEPAPPIMDRAPVTVPLQTGNIFSCRFTGRAPNHARSQIRLRSGAGSWTRKARNLVVVITHGIDHEMSSVGRIIALGGMTAGLRISIFLTSSGVDIVRRGAADLTHVKPLEPLAYMLRDFPARGGTLWAYTPVKSRGYSQENILNDVIITGASVMHELIKRGAATLSF